jgi:hypothetical protein
MLFVSTLMMMGLLPLASGSGFLHQQSVSKLNTDVVETMLLADFSPANRDRVALMREDLRPLFSVLPKNQFGQLEPVAVRYALHRFFVQKYGWYVRGLDPVDAAESTPSPGAHVEILKDRVPHYIQSILAEKMQGNGLGIDELAVFAATLNDLMEKDAVDSFHQVFEALGFNASDVSENDATRSVQGVVARLILNESQIVSGPRSVAKIERELAEIYADWPDVVMWLADTHQSLRWREKSRQNPFRHTTMTREIATESVKDIMHRIVDVANYGCPALKENLVNLEYQGSGRVRVRDFYSKLQGSRPESLEFLRQLGVLDESEPQMPMILIPNLVQSRSNCLVDGSYYSLCCPNECEGLLGHLELQLQVPSATPARISEVVAGLPSDTVHVPRNLSSVLLGRLDQIAEHHGGVVPLHGRLFAQWMHHAYPRECPYPQHEKFAKPMTQDEWIQHKKIGDVLADPQEVNLHQSMLDHQNMVSESNLPWHMIEELVGDPKSVQPKGRSGILRTFVALMALASMAVPLVSMSREFMASKPTDKTHMV